MIVLRNGVEALDYIFCRGDYSDRDINNLPTIILLDIKLPKVNGLEVDPHNAEFLKNVKAAQQGLIKP